MDTFKLQWDYAYHADTAPEKRALMMDRVAFLRSLPLFRDLGEDTLHYLAAESHHRVFHVGDTVVHQGEGGTTCHVIVEGRLRVFVVGEDGREFSVRLLGPGEIIGEMALFEELPRSANVDAIDETHTLELHRDALLETLRRSPALALSLLKALSARLRYATEEAEGLASLTVPERLLRRLDQFSTWCGRPVEGGVQIMLPMSQHELATLVGASRESVNRALVRLREEGKVRIESGWIVLLDEGGDQDPPDEKE